MTSLRLLSRFGTNCPTSRWNRPSFGCISASIIRNKAIPCLMLQGGANIMSRVYVREGTISMNPKALVALLPLMKISTKAWRINPNKRMKWISNNFSQFLWRYQNKKNRSISISEIQGTMNFHKQASITSISQQGKKLWSSISKKRRWRSTLLTKKRNPDT